MANIEQRVSEKGKVSYRAKIRLKGYPTQSATFARKTDAGKWVQQTEAAIREGRHFKTAQSRRHTLSELVERFISNELPKLPKVEKLMASQLRWWAVQLGHHTLADVTPALIVEQRDRLSRYGTPTKRKISPATVNRYLAALSIAFSAAVKEWGWLDDSPLRKVKKLKEPMGRVRFLSDEERSALLKACKSSQNRFLYPIVVLALSTGARKTELLTVQWKDVDLRRGLVTLHETKNRERRALPARGHALEILKELKKTRRLDTTLLFPSHRDPGKPINIREPWTRALEKADLQDFRFHDLRHSAASYLAMNGATLTEIAAVLGHKTLQMVQRYSHLSETHVADVVASMNKKIFE